MFRDGKSPDFLQFPQGHEMNKWVVEVKKPISSDMIWSGWTNWPQTFFEGSRPTGKGHRNFWPTNKSLSFH